MLSVVAGGHNGNKKDPQKDILKAWRVTTENGDVYIVKGTEILVGDDGEALIVFNRGTIVFSEKTHVNVSIDNKEWVTKEARPRKKKRSVKTKSPTKKTAKV